MSDGADQPRPIWRTPLAAILAAWMAMVVAMALNAWRLVETVPGEALAAIAFVLLVVAPVGLLVWSLWAMLRDPITGWMAPAALLFFCGGLGPAFGPLTDVGLQMTFEAHRPVYDQVVAEAAAGRLRPDAAGRVEGRREGVRFSYRVDRPQMVEFAWEDHPWETGIRYNAIPCRPSRTLKCLDRGRRLGGDYFHYWSVAPDLTGGPWPAP